MKQLYGVLTSTVFALTLGACTQGVSKVTNPAAGALARGRAVAESPGQATVFTSAGDIKATVDAYRDQLGTLNANTPGSRGSGRREINWDAVPALNTNTNDFPSDFFNQPVVGRARGLVSTTSGTGFRVSDRNFSDLSDNFQFVFFSPVRTFAPVGSETMTATFFVPGSNVAATTTGFGVVFCDVDHRGSASIRAFDAEGRNLGLFLAPAAPGGVSFVGVTFPQAVIARVEITSGQAPVSPGAVDFDSRDGEPARDLVVMDDFIYGEPRDPSSGSLLSAR